MARIRIDNQLCVRDVLRQMPGVDSGSVDLDGIGKRGKMRVINKFSPIISQYILISFKKMTNHITIVIVDWKMYYYLNI